MWKTHNKQTQKDNWLFSQQTLPVQSLVDRNCQHTSPQSKRNVDKYFCPSGTAIIHTYPLILKNSHVTIREWPLKATHFFEAGSFRVRCLYIFSYRFPFSCILLGWLRCKGSFLLMARINGQVEVRLPLKAVLSNLLSSASIICRNPISRYPSIFSSISEEAKKRENESSRTFTKVSR